MGIFKNQQKDLFERHASNPILRSTDWPYTANSVFNPAATLFQGKTLLLVRVEDRRGFSHLTKAISENGFSDWVVDSQPTLEADPAHYPEELWGLEDPRITYLQERQEWAITCTAYSSRGPLVALAMTKDFVHFQRMGPIMPPDDKDAALLPRQVNHEWVLIHRPVPANHSAHIWISRSPDLVHWGQHRVLLPVRPGGWWDDDKVGLSAPPLETKDGWLLLYHGVRQTAAGSIYRLGLALLDLEKPEHVLRRSDEWVFGPKQSYERHGDVDNAVFPCGWVLEEDQETIRMYYGAADTSVAVATARLSELMAYILACPEPTETD